METSVAEWSTLLRGLGVGSANLTSIRSYLSANGAASRVQPPSSASIANIDEVRAALAGTPQANYLRPK